MLAGVAAIAVAAVSARLAGRVDARTFTAFGFLGVSLSALLLPFAAGALPIAAGLAALGRGLAVLLRRHRGRRPDGPRHRHWPEEKLARAGTSLQLIAAAALVLGSLLAGLLAGQIGIRPTLGPVLGAARRPAAAPAARRPRRPARPSTLSPSSPYERLRRAVGRIRQADLRGIL